jgi:hypothetical protein
MASAFGALQAQVDRSIANRGWALVSTMGYPSMTYTVGLTEKFNHPEFVIAGNFPLHIMSAVIENAVGALEQGYKFNGYSQVDGLIAAGPVGCKAIRPDELTRMRIAKERTPSFQAIQLVLPDQEGHLPWQEGCAPYWLQAQPAWY